MLRNQKARRDPAGFGGASGMAPVLTRSIYEQPNGQYRKTGDKLFQVEQAPRIEHQASSCAATAASREHLPSLR